MVNFAYTTDCRMTPLLSYFGESHDGSCGHCDNCKQPPRVEDATEDARKLLSAVARTEQRFGLRHVIDVLRGSDDERVTRRGHDALSVFGIGADQPAAHWRRVAETLIHEGHLGVTPDDFRTLHLTESSVAVLRGEASVSITQPRALASKSERRAARATRATAAVHEAAVDDALFERLRALRRDIARDQDVPPYVIFGDVSLKQMAARKPTTHDAFAGITGVGQFKLEQYGPAFIEAIREYVETSA